MKTSRVLLITLVCLAAAVGNSLLSILVMNVLDIPLFMDTMFNIAITFEWGLVPGLVTAVLSNITKRLFDIMLLHTSGLLPYPTLMVGFTLCSMTTALLTWLFARLLPEPVAGEPFSRRFVMIIIILFALSIIMALVESLMGGLTAALNPTSSIGPQLNFQGMLYLSGFSRFPVEILSLLPINLIDRPLSVFVGYGLVIGFRLLGRRVQKSVPRRNRVR
jgi:hypothetical protein